MDSNRFDAISQSFSSRRTLGMALGGMALFNAAGLAGAKKKRKKRCKPKAGTCNCKAGQQCYANGGCGAVCNGERNCPAGCFCTDGLDTVSSCTILLGGDCANAPIVCNSGDTADCPKGTICLAQTTCPGGPGARCVPLCQA